MSKLKLDVERATIVVRLSDGKTYQVMTGDKTMSTLIKLLIEIDGGLKLRAEPLTTIELL